MTDYITKIKQKLHIDLERVNIGQRAKGQLISKCLYSVIVSTKKPTNSFRGFLPLTRSQMKKIKALYYANWALFNIIGIIKFLIQLLFRGEVRNPEKKISLVFWSKR